MSDKMKMKPCQMEFLRTKRFDKEDDNNSKIIYSCKYRNVAICLQNEGELSNDDVEKIKESIINYCEKHCCQN